MISDVQDILDVPTAPTDVPITKEAILNDAKKKSTKKVESTFKRPEGMAREVFNLLLIDRKDPAPLIPTETGAAKLGGYKNIKARLGLRKVRPWHCGPFVNPARADSLLLTHWRRVEDEDKEYPFARFNKVLEIQQFNRDDYNKLALSSTKFSLEETEHLFALCIKFDLRWPVVYDRWDNDRFPIRRSLEDLKERFYDVSNKLIKARTPEGEEPKLLSFDADHERRRKEQLQKLWNRTDEQIEEEAFLMEELRRIEARKKERARKAQDLQKLISMADRSPATPSTPSSQSTAPKKKFYKTVASTSSLETMNIEANSGVKFPEFKGPGVHLRSQRMKLPPTLGQRKVKAVDVALDKLDIEFHPIATDEIVTQFNDLRSDVVLLYELKSALSNCEFELESLKHQHHSTTGMELAIPNHLRVSREDGGQESSSPFKRRVADALEVATGPTPQVGRKKKVMNDQVNLIKKMKKL